MLLTNAILLQVDNLELEIIDSPVVFNDTRKGVKVTPKVTPTAPKSPDVKSNFSIFVSKSAFFFLFYDKL